MVINRSKIVKKKSTTFIDVYARKVHVVTERNEEEIKNAVKHHIDFM